MSNTLNEILKTINNYGYVRIVPRIDLDSLIASSILFKNLNEHRVKTSINYDPKTILDQKDEPTILINLPKTREQPIMFTMNFNMRESVSAYVSYYLDKIYGVSIYDKVLSIATGIYQGLDTVEGFKGIESEILKELTSKEIIEHEPGFRFWGRLKLDLVNSIYRTLIPFMPGLTGEPEKINELLSHAIGGKTGVIKHIHIEQNKDLAARFLEHLLNYLSKIIGASNAKKIIRKILGNVYVAKINNKVIELNEAVGLLNIYLSLRKNSPQYLSIISVDPNTLFGITTLTDNVIDELIIDISIALNQFIKTNQNIFEIEGSIERPEIFIEILRSMDMLPENKAVIMYSDGEYYTSLSELFRVGREDAETLYAYCDENQLCMVDRDGNIIKT
ncbi:hypothetical protein [Staphylothermus hellenicus]|uniref:Uncharacterized protein n=1 Tax=Staphylothermus hellenicus (strain DSM 12710 / JCM 10830 / BK20S6-10-b1 / P8) TaxID=591019 RepID=D7DAB4_STAHD|nr:hypothetical protein [Staphylothermus hellenicus]ADI32710.1 hypothetical protein Shell_1625 [Staphylothermus hellenicus DSM 12710]